MKKRLEINAREMRSKVFAHMLKTRGWKYKAFLRYLRLFKYFSLQWTRGEFLECYYTLMRYLDDIVDGDAPLPAESPSVIDYITQKIEFSINPDNPKDAVDYLLIYCFDLARRFDEDFSEETQDILNSLLFDANRCGQLTICPEEELNRHFHKLDIRGTIRATLKVFGEDPEKYLALEPLGMASRYQFDLEDFEADIAAGYVNISQEECEKFLITEKDLHSKDSINILKWKQAKASHGLALLTEHRRNLRKTRFSLLARATFPLVYEHPARKCFESILKEEIPDKSLISA